MIGRERIYEVVDRIVKEYDPEKVILYGSYRWGHASEDSDLDLFILKDTKDEWVMRFVKVKEIVYNPKDYIPVEPIVYTPDELASRLRKGDAFLEKILSEGEVLYERAG